MWPKKPMEYVKLENDDNGRHFGLFLEKKLISIISVFVENNEAQFRKFATLKEFQGFGYGTFLLRKIMDIIRDEGIKKLWCNARLGKTGFYEKFDLKPTNITFKKGGIEYVIMEKYFC